MRGIINRVTARGLSGLIQCDISMPDQCVRIAAVAWKECNASVHAQFKTDFSDRERICQCIQQSASQIDRGSGTKVWQDYAELNVTDPGRQRSLSCDFTDARTDLLQQFIADQMAQRVVDFPKPGQLHDQQRQGLSSFVRLLDCILQIASQFGAVW